MFKMIKNKVGLEFEFLVHDKSGNLVFPGNLGFSFDDFCIIGEARCKPGETPGEVLGNLHEKLYEIQKRAKKKNCQLVYKGWEEISMKQYAKVLRKMGYKPLSESSNIYGTDILSLTNEVVDENGAVTGKLVSTGLHVHFSSHSMEKVKIADSSYKTISTSVITYPDVKFIVEEFDKNLLETTMKSLPNGLKFRHKGFWEEKSHGFEYRSLPATSQTLFDLAPTIVEFAFEKLAELSIS